MGAHIVNEMAVSLKEIINGINESSQIIGEIAKASQQQSTSIARVNDSVDQVADIVQQNSATAVESAAAAEQSAAAAEKSATAAQEMNAQADMLQKLISQFKLRK